MKVLLLKIVNLFNLYNLFKRFTKNTATIFMLHRIDSPEKSTEAGFSPALLREYFNYLKNNNYNVISLSSYIDALKNNKSTYKSVIFTIDDGYRNFYLNAYEIFKEYGFPATVFITSDFIEGNLFFWWDKIEYLILQSEKREIKLSVPGFDEISIRDLSAKKAAVTAIIKHCKTLNNKEKIALIQELEDVTEVDVSGQPKNEYEPLKWQEITEMSKNGIEFHPHTKTHPIISKVPLEQKIEELSIPKQVIEEKLGMPANIFCYPNGQIGDFDEETISSLISLDYVAAVTGMPGLDNTKVKTDMYRIKRFNLSSNEILFKQYICGLENFKRKLLGFSSSKYK